MRVFIQKTNKQTLIIVTVLIFIGLWIIKQFIPSGHDIIFTDHYKNKIYIVDADGAHKTQLSNWFDAHSPDWSQDGSQIVYIGRSDPFGTSEIYTMQVNGANKTRLTHNSVFESSPAWSPDGTQIVFAANLEEECLCQDLYIIDANGSNLTHLTMNKEGDGNTVNLAEDDAPIWSPDGQHIVFVRDWYYDNPKIYMINSDGSNLTALTHHEDGDYSPTWSPDSTKIAYVSRQDGNAEIYIMNFDDASQIRITNNPMTDNNPAWSPDSARIAYVSEQDGNAEIYIINLDGSGQTRITNTDADDNNPVWSPDGTQIAYVSEQDGSAEIYVVNAAGSDPIRIVSGEANYRTLLWQP
ncbi:MAG: DUF5050 domain-containing protein [Chloroflexi bacterium]|nr:DUF5050 domain-containing protein [Chloroflexota bacterium]